MSAIDHAARRTATVLGLAALAAAGLWLASGIAAVEPGSQAVVLRWGSPVRVQGPGLALAWPRPVERVVIIPGPERTLTTPVGASATPAGDAQPRAARSATLTGDSGLVLLGGSVVWAVADPRAYVVATVDGDRRAQRALGRAWASAAIAACATRPVEGVLVTGTGVDERTARDRDRLRGDLLAGLNARLEALGHGIRAVRVDLQVELPEAARPAFAEVLSAAQNAERAVADARAMAERSRQEAAQARDRRLAQADAVARELVTRADVATGTIKALAAQRDPQAQRLMRERIGRERLEAVLRRVGQVVAVDRNRPIELWLSGTSP